MTLLILFILFNFGEIIAKNCVLDLKDAPENFPFFIRKSNEIYPQKTNKDSAEYLAFEEKEKFLVGCSSKDTNKNALNFSKEYESNVECSSKGQLMVKYSKTNLGTKDFECTAPNKEKVVIEGNECGENLINVKIIFEASTPQNPMISTCHNPHLDATVMTFHTIHGGNLNAAQKSNDRPSFKEGHKDLYKTIDANDAYTQKNQLDVVSEIVGSKERGKLYIDVAKSYYFARGHLAPDGDFIYIREQNATYYYFNVVPQWQAINNGNWKALEFVTRKLALSKAMNLNIYTGSYEILKLLDAKSNPVDIYLAKDKESKWRLPAPKLTWKVLHNPSEKKATAIIMINNPHQTILQKNDIICQDICSKISWINWNTTDFKKGYTYCCDLPSFKKVVKVLPDFGPVELFD